MTSFSATYRAGLAVPPRVLRQVAALAEFKGRQALLTQTRPEVLKRLRQVAVIESVESSSRLKNILVGPQTFDRIVRRADAPESADRSQAELAGYRDALALIHQNAGDMPPSESTVRQLHQTLMRYTAAGGGDYKRASNDIVERDEQGAIERVRDRTTAPALTPATMITLHDGLAQALAVGEIEPILLVPLYAHDFLCIQPFPDGKGRMARLMSLLLLYRLGFEVGRYISLERVIEDSKATYYDSLALSDIGWAEGRHDHVPFTEYMLGVILSAYRDFERTTDIDLDHGTRGRMVERAVSSLPATFRLLDVEKACPPVGRDTIRSALARMKRGGKDRERRAGARRLVAEAGMNGGKKWMKSH